MWYRLASTFWSLVVLVAAVRRLWCSTQHSSQSEYRLDSWNASTQILALPLRTAWQLSPGTIGFNYLCMHSLIWKIRVITVYFMRLVWGMNNLKYKEHLEGACHTQSTHCCKALRNSLGKEQKASRTCAKSNWKEQHWPLEGVARCVSQNSSVCAARVHLLPSLQHRSWILRSGFEMGYGQSHHSWVAVYLGSLLASLSFLVPVLSLRANHFARVNGLEVMHWLFTIACPFLFRKDTQETENRNLTDFNDGHFSTFLHLWNHVHLTSLQLL